VYLVLRARWNRHGQEWVKLRVPMRPRGSTGWVRRQDLGAFGLTHARLVVDRRHLRIDLYERGHRVWSAPVAVGKPSTPTPAGHFWIREKIPIHDRSSGYWPFALGTSDYSNLTDWPKGGVVAIHGPYYDPSGIPGHISHGCIRLRTWDDAWLARHVGIGTPIVVR
jgi:lipoprotein-anchoring transpeptidase ErfK/SrfK